MILNFIFRLLSETPHEPDSSIFGIMMPQAKNRGYRSAKTTQIPEHLTFREWVKWHRRHNGIIISGKYKLNHQ